MNSGIILEDGVFGRRAVITSAWQPQMGDYMKDHGVLELELNQGKGWQGKDVEFLAEMSGLQAFEIFDFNIRDIAPVHFLRSLRRLGVTTYCSTELRFAAFPHIEDCGLEWRPRAESLFDCTTLRRLFVNRYKGKNTDPFSRLLNLESLAILNAPIEDLHGLGTLRSLESLRLGNLRRLESLAGIEGLVGLEEVDIDTCRGIRSIDELGSLTNLRRLYINNGGDIESLRPLERLVGLERVSFYESTNIKDGDLSPLSRQRHLSRISFQNRRHYSHRREDFGVAFTG